MNGWYASLGQGSKVIIIERNAHLPHLEGPELYLGALREFLHVAEKEVPGYAPERARYGTTGMPGDERVSGGGQSDGSLIREAR
jgi:hypothetical protein